MPADEIYDFMKIQNRPFSANEIMQNVGKEHGKTAVQKALDKLVSKKKLFDKIYGKQKIYCIVQENVETANLEEDLKKLDREINEVSLNLKESETELLKNSTELKALQSKLTIEEAKRSIIDLEDEIKTLKEKLNAFTESEANPMSEEEKIKICSEYEKYVKEYKKRKRMCKEMIDTILEGYPKTKKHLFEEIGIETDEDADFTFNEILKTK